MLIGCCCTVTCTSLCITVTGCGGAPIVGAAVTATGPGGYSGSGTTNGSGVCCLTITAGGTYSIGVTKTNYASASAIPFTATCAGPNDTTIRLSPATGYSCTADRCCPTGSQTGPPYPVLTYPGTGFLSDGTGTVSMTGTPSGGYTGSATRTAAQAWNASTCGLIGPASVPVFFTLICNGGSQWTLTLSFADCYSGTTCSNVYQLSHGGYGYPATATTPNCNLYDSGSTAATNTTCPPSTVHLSFTTGFPLTAGSPGSIGYQVYGTSNTFTFTL